MLEGLMTTDKVAPSAGSWRKATVPCPPRTDNELIAAVHVLGASLLVAIKSAINIEELKQAGIYPVSPPVAGFHLHAWQILQTMLVEERRLIEFLVGPHTFTDKGTGATKSNRDTICINCFGSSITDTWWMNDDVRVRLRWRAQRTNKRVAHLDWLLIDEYDSRVVSGIWQTGYLKEIVNQFRDFTEWLYDRRPHVAEILAPQYIDPASARVMQLPVPGPPF